MTPEDIKICERAAKAAGIPVEPYSNESPGFLVIKRDGRACLAWRPLQSKAQCFDLQVKLHIATAIHDGKAYAGPVECADDDNPTEVLIGEDGDEGAALQRAIVIAASELCP